MEIKTWDTFFPKSLNKLNGDGKLTRKEILKKLNYLSDAEIDILYETVFPQSTEYGDFNKIPKFTIDQTGRITKIETVAAFYTGLATLVAGTVTVMTDKVTADSIILLTPQEGGALAGIVRVSARVAGVSFDITSTDNTDDADVGWTIVEPT